MATSIATDEARHVLGECVLFDELGPEARKTLFAHVRVRSCAAGENIFLMGSAGDSLMAVLHGSVRISMSSAEGKEIIVAIIRPREIFGEIAMMDGKERTADARAIGACRLAILERRDVLSFLEDHPDVWPKLVEVLCGRLRKTDQQIAGIAMLGLPARLANALLRFAGAKESSRNGGTFAVNISQRELGNICGASRESINKHLGDWQRRGIVEMESGAINVIDMTAVEELASLAEG
jgi:CRP/FNR family transcriptional regulator, cyclic AMP receptor protein